MKFQTGVKNIHMEGTVSPIFVNVLVLILTKKNGYLLDIFANHIFYIA